MSVAEITHAAGHASNVGWEPMTSAFARLRELLQGSNPPDHVEPVLLHLGEVGFAPPTDLLAPLARAEDWSRYPPLGGTHSLRHAYEGWLQRRFGVTRTVRDGRLTCEPTSGTKQALAVSIALAVQRAHARGIERPAVVLPNPFYPTYLAATRAACAEPIFYSTQRGRIGSALVTAAARAAARAAAIVLCNPGSPGGEIVDEAEQTAAAETAASAGATLIVDECYVDLFAAPVPTGFLSLCEHGAVDTRNTVVLHTLSKRSGAPGLRSGFATGDPDLIAAYASYNRSCGVSTPVPVCAAAAALWADDDHVQRLRDAIARNWDVADAHLADVPGYRRARTGFFVWLPVADDEAATSLLWRSQGLMVMPGRYLAAAGDTGVNPGLNMLRIALVHEPERLSASLRRLRAALPASAD